MFTCNTTNSTLFVRNKSSLFTFVKKREQSLIFSGLEKSCFLKSTILPNFAFDDLYTGNKKFIVIIIFRWCLDRFYLMILSQCYYLVSAGCEVMYGKMDRHYRVEGNNLCNSTRYHRWYLSWKNSKGDIKHRSEMWKRKLSLTYEWKKEKLRKCQESLRLTKGSQDTSINWRKELEEWEQ